MHNIKTYSEYYKCQDCGTRHKTVLDALNHVMKSPRKEKPRALQPRNAKVSPDSQK